MSFYQRLQRVATTFVLAVALLLAVSACDNTVTDPGLEEEEDPEEVVVTDDAVVVDQESTPIQRVAGDTLIFQLSDSSPAFEPGNVVVGEEGEGFLRRVVEVDVSGDEAVLITEEASLVDVVERGTLQESFDLSTTTRAGLEWQVTHIEEGVTADAGALGLELEEVDLPGITGLSVTFTNGSVSFDPDIDFQLEIRRGRLNEMLVAASGQLDFNVDVEVTASQEIVRKDSTLLARFDGQPITFFIGFVPVVILPTLEFIAGYEVGLGQEGSITSGLESLNAITAGAEYSNGNWSPILDRSNTLEPRPLIWDQTASAEAKGYIRPKLSFTVYGVAGPFINSNGYVRTQATISPPNWAWGVYAGLDGNFGGEVKIFDNVLAKYEHKFAQVEWELAGESGEVGGEVEATLTGQITDVETSQGVEGATVIGTDPSSGEQLVDTVTDAAGAYATTFTVDEPPADLTVEVQADAYEAVEQTISFEEEMTLDLALTPVDDPEGGEATISGQITDADTGNGIEDATVTGTDLSTGTEVFAITTDAAGNYEQTFTYESEIEELEVFASASGYQSASEVISFEESMGLNLELSPAEVDGTRLVFNIYRYGDDVVQYEIPLDETWNNSWHQVAVTREGNTVEFYVNGQREGVWTDDGIDSEVFGDNSFARAFTLGGIIRNWFGNRTYRNSFRGLIDDASIYPHKLSQAQIAELWNDGAGVDPAVKGSYIEQAIAYWPFENPENGSIEDISGQGVQYNATFEDGATVSANSLVGDTSADFLDDGSDSRHDTNPTVQITNTGENLSYFETGEESFTYHTYIYPFDVAAGYQQFLFGNWYSNAATGRSSHALWRVRILD